MLFRSNKKDKDRGIYLGRLMEGTRIREEVWYGNKNLHAVTIGPNRSGKGTGLITTTIAAAKRSIICVDPKLEQGAITARARTQRSAREKASRRVLIINPFHILADALPHLRSHGYNPLAAIDETHDNFTDDSNLTGIAIVKEPLDGNGAFFGGSAQDWVTCAIMQEKIDNKRDGNLARVRKMITQPFTPSGLLKTI